MNQFLVPPEYCIIIKAIQVSKTLRSASQLLGIDPAQLNRKIQKIATDYSFLQKLGNRWVLTEQGTKLAQWVDESALRQKILLEEKPHLKIASFTWLAEQMLIPHVKKLCRITNDKYSWKFNIAAAVLEDELISGKADYVITCHAPNDPLIAHKVFNQDPWFIVIPASWEKEFKNIKSDNIQQALNKKPFIRLTTLNPDQMLGFTPQTIADVMMDGVIGVRTAVINNLGWSCLPGFSLISHLKNKDLVKLNLNSTTSGQLSIWWLRSRKDTAANIKSLSKWLIEISG
jgi:DNA-binding transcriptional LysR family regulator